MPIDDFPDLLRRAQGSDEAAFNTLFRDVQPIMLRYLRSMASAETAEDVASETWVAVIRALDRFVGDEIGAFRAWVLAIARRRWVDEVRRRSRRPELLTDIAPENVAADDVAATAEETMSTERALALIATLPPEQAEVLVLRVVADLDVTQTAEIVGKSAGAVRVLAHRGLKRLAADLGPGVTKSRSPTVEH